MVFSTLIVTLLLMPALLASVVLLLLVLLHAMVVLKVSGPPLAQPTALFALLARKELTIFSPVPGLAQLLPVVTAPKDSTALLAPLSVLLALLVRRVPTVSPSLSVSTRPSLALLALLELTLLVVLPTACLALKVSTLLLRRLHALPAHLARRVLMA